MKKPAPLSSPRAAIMLVFAAFGATVGIFAGSVPAIVRQTGVSSEALGLALSGSTVATVTAMSLAGILARRLSYRSILLASLPLAAVSLTLVMTVTSVPFLFLTLLAYGLTLGMTDAVMNAEASAIEHDLRRPVFTMFHGSVSLSVAFFAIASSLITARFGLGAAAAAALVVIALAWLMVWRNVPARPLPTSVQTAATRVASLPLVLMGMAVGLVIASETSAIFWSAKMLDEMAPSLAAISGLGAAFFGLCNCVVRFPGDRLRARFGDVRLMMVSLGTAILGFLGLGFSGSFGFSVFAFALVGLGSAMLCPCIFALATAEVPSNRAAGMAFVSFVAGVPRIAAPYIFGWVAGSFSISTAFGLCAIMMFAALIVVAMLGRHAQSPASVRQS